MNATDSVVDGEVIINVTVPVNAVGYVVVNVNGTNYTINLTAGQDRIAIKVTQAGSYNVNVTYIGDDQYLSSDTNTTFNVDKLHPNINVTVNNNGVIPNGTDVDLFIHAPSDITGIVNVTVWDIARNKNTTYTVHVNEGNGTLHIDAPLIGDYKVNVTYIENRKYYGNENYTSFEVYNNKKPLEILPGDTDVDKAKTVIVDLQGNQTGKTLIIIISNSSGEIMRNESVLIDHYSDLFNFSSAQWRLDLLDAGQYDVKAIYTEVDGDYVYAHEGNNSFKVNKLSSQIKIKEIRNITVCENATIELEIVLDSRANDGNISVFVDGREYKTNTSTLKVTVPDLGADNYTVEAFYHGNRWYKESNATSSFKVEKNPAPISINVTSIKVGETEQINVTLPKDVNGRVLLDIGDNHYYANVTNGVGTFNIAGLKAGEYNATVIYDGDYKYFTNSTTKAFTVSKHPSQINITISHEGIVANGTDVNITVHAPLDATGKVNITISDDVKNTTYTIYVNDGVGILHLESPEIGIYNVTAKYLGDDKYIGSENKTLFEVYITGKSMVVETEPVTVDKNESIKVWVSGNRTGENVTVIVYNSEGNVVAEHNATFDVFYNSQLNMTSAELTLDKLPAGDYKVEAFYLERNGTRIVEHAGTGRFTVSKLPTTISIKEIRNITVGENVTIELEFEPTEATGNISVFVNGVEHIINITNLTITVPNLPAEEYFVHAFYYGDHNYYGSNASAAFKVSKMDPVIKVNATNITVGDKVLIEITAPNNLENPILVDVGGAGYYVNITGGKGQLYVPYLASGEYNVTARYLGDDNYNSGNNSTSFKVSKVASSVNVTVENITVGDKAIINVETPEDLCGNVTVKVDDKDYTVFVSGGKGTLVVPGLDVGPHTVNVTFDGCKKYEPSNNTATFNVNKVALNENDMKVVDQGNGTVVVVLPGNATGNVTIKVGDKEFNATVVNGTAVIQLENVTPGTHEVEVIYSGDSTYNSTTTTANVTAPKYDSPMNITVSEIKSGENGTVTVKLPENATGIVIVTIDGKQYPGEVINGTAVVKVENLTAGNKTVVVEYTGDNNYTSGYAVGNFTVVQSPVVPDVFTVVDQGNGTVVIVLPEDAKGNVTITVDGKNFTADVVNGTAVVNLDNVTPGAHEVEVLYSGDDKYTNATKLVNVTAPKYDSPINITVSEIKSGENGTITVTLPDNATGNVTIYVDGKQYHGEVIDGVVVVKVENLTAGDKTVVVEYSGDDNYDSVYAIGNFTVEQSPVVPDVFTVVDQGNGTVVVVLPSDATGNVTITVDGKNYTADVVNGTAVVNLDNVTTGTHDIEVIYSGDGKYTNSTVNTEVTAPKYDTPIKVEAQDSLVGDKAIITVTVPENATGNVTIEIDGVKYTSEIKDGKAVFEIENLTAGTKTIAVEYIGDDNYLANHTTGNITISKCPSTVSATITDVDVGENVTITVTVPKDATGQVLIDIDGVGYYVNVTGGKGVAQIPRMPNGVYNVNLTYTGDDKYLPSSSKGSFNVTKIPSFVIPHAQDITVGDNEVITLTVPADATGSVTVGIDGKEYNFDLDDGTLSAPGSSGETYSVAVDKGKGVLVISGLPKGEYVVSVRYNGDSKYLPSTNTTTFIVSTQDTDMNVEDLGNGTVIVHLPKDAKGNVTVKVGNETYTADVVNGTAVINLDNTAPGIRDAEVIYSGDGNYGGKTIDTTISIPKYPTPIDVEVDDIYVGDTAVVTVTVPKDAKGTVTIEIDGVEYNATVVDGKAVFKVTGLKEGTKTVAVRFDDDDDGYYEWNATTAQFKVSKVASSIKASSKNIIAGKDEVIVVTVPSDATGKVCVKIDGVGYYGDIINGKAKIIVHELPIGNYKVTVVYEGDDKYLPSNTTASFIVSKPSAPISANGDTIQQGQDATIVIELPKDATGTVTIVVNGKKYTANVVNGKAVFKIPGLPKGSYNVPTFYSGDKKYSANFTMTTVVVEDSGSDHPGENHASAESELSLSRYSTGNPILVLLLIILAMCTTQIRRFRK